MKSLVVLLVISPIIFMGMKSLWTAIFVKKSLCGTCSKCAAGNFCNPKKK